MKVSEIPFKEIEMHPDLDSTQVAYHGDEGSITILDRRTGFTFCPRDTETGYRDIDGTFWLASGMFDIRDYPDLSISDAIEKIKAHANTCIGVKT